MGLNADIEQLAALLGEYTQQREKILSRDEYTKVFNNNAAETYSKETALRCEKRVAALWGRILSEDYHYYLESTGSVWRALNVAERAMRDASEAAERAVQPASVDHARLRAESIIMSAETPAELMDAYMAAPVDIRNAFMLYGAALLPREQAHNDQSAPMFSGESTHAGITWRKVAQRWKKDLTAALQTDSVKAADDNLRSTMETVQQAYEITKRAINQFGRKSWYLGNVLQGITYEYSPVRAASGSPELGAIMLRVERRGWGLVRSESGGAMYTSDSGKVS